MTQGPGPNLIPLTKLTLSEILSGSLNSLRRMPKPLLGIGLFSGFIIGLSNIVATALVVQNGETLNMPELPKVDAQFNDDHADLVAMFSSSAV